MYVLQLCPPQRMLSSLKRHLWILNLKPLSHAAMLRCISCSSMCTNLCSCDFHIYEHLVGV